MSRIYSFSKKLGEFKYPIRNLLDLGDRYIIILDIPSGVVFPENVYCLSKEGHIIWQIEKHKMPFEFSSYLELAYENETLTVYTPDLRRKVDILSGKVIESQFVK